MLSKSVPSNTFIEDSISISLLEKESRDSLSDNSEYVLLVIKKERSASEPCNCFKYIADIEDFGKINKSRQVYKIS